MSDLDKFINGVSPDDWMKAIPQYARASISQISLEPEKTVELWLGRMGGAHTAPLGAPPVPNNFVENFKKEFHGFLCGDTKYDADRSKILKNIGAGKDVIVASVAGAIGAYMGAAAALLIPAVALMFIVVGKASLNAWCASFPSGKD